MTLQQRIAALITAVGADIKALYTRSVPAGGTTGQVLTKTSNADYDNAWATPTVTQAILDEIQATIWFWL
ncbi:hypothetical protein [Runella sp.]|uniref:hypothetical protein n=1 Tax=Runella sp. TaxID=1960881 RepID=UPI003018605F